MTEKSDNRVGHLNTILARGGGNLNDPVQMPGLCLRGRGGMLKFQVDRRITSGLFLLFLLFFVCKVLHYYRKKINKIQKKKIRVVTRYIFRY